GHLDGLAEEARLLEAVLAGGRVDDEQGLMWGAFEPLRDHAPDLGELLHEVRLRVQAAGRVDDDDVASARLRGLDRVEGDGSGIGAVRGADEVGPGAVRPDLELLVRRRSEGVRGGDDDGMAVVAEAGGKLAGGRGL